MCKCQSQFPKLSLSPFFLGNDVCFLHLWLYLCFVKGSFIPFFSDFTYKWYHKTFVWLISLTVIISRPIKVSTTELTRKSPQIISYIYWDYIFIYHTNKKEACFSNLNTYIFIFIMIKRKEHLSKGGLVGKLLECFNFHFKN